MSIQTTNTLLAAISANAVNQSSRNRRNKGGGPNGFKDVVLICVIGLFSGFIAVSYGDYQTLRSVYPDFKQTYFEHIKHKAASLLGYK